MPVPACSPSPTRPQGLVPPCATGARRGHLRWAASIRLEHAPLRLPQPLVRGDGVVLLELEAVVRAFSPAGEPLWERDLAGGDGYWAGLLCVDADDAAWLLGPEGLLCLTREGAVRRVNPAFRSSPYAPTQLLPWGGFVSFTGTDEGWYVYEAGPSRGGEIALYDDEGQRLCVHAVEMGPGGVCVAGDRIVAFFADDRAQLALVLDRTGQVVERRPFEGDERHAVRWRQELADEVAAATDAAVRPVTLPTLRHWTYALPAAEPGSRGIYYVEPVWGETVVLRYCDAAGDEVARVSAVSADQPTVDAEDWCYVTRVRRDRLTLEVLRHGQPQVQHILAEELDRATHAHPHAGIDGATWTKTGFFHAPTALGPDGSTLVLGRAAGGVTLFCVE